jgi:DNA-binding IclR family transcriptional regulator
MPQTRTPSAAVRFPEGTSIARLLAAVDRPRRERDLARELGISRQMAHQNIVRLLALGLLRSADPDRPTQLVALATDTTLLLRIGEERVLSAFPDGAYTTARNLASRLRQPVEAVRAVLDTLKAQGLAAEAPGGTDGRVALTAAGAAQFQRDASARRAEPWTLPVKSDRVQAVLERLAEAPARTVDIGRELGIERHTVNALMQYLKRRGLARKAGDDLFAPHEITDTGRRVAAEMSRRMAVAGN